MALEAGQTCRGGTEACHLKHLQWHRYDYRRDGNHQYTSRRRETVQLTSQTCKDNLQMTRSSEKKNHAGTRHTCTGQQRKVMYRRARRSAWKCNRLENDCKHVSVAIMWNHLPEAQNHDPGRLGSQIDTLDMCAYVLSINDPKIPADMAPEIVRNPQSDWETPMLTWWKCNITQRSQRLDCQ